MTDSPRSERSQTRFSTPVSELDDHRNLPSSLPRIEMNAIAHNPRSRRGTHGSAVVGNEQPDMLAVNEMLQRQGMVSRDFECAIEDDKSNPDNMAPQLISATSPTARRNTFRRPPELEREPPPKSSASSTSGSVSPPNSVVAFAENRRRERAGTVESKHGSDLNLTLKRTVSVGTHHRRGTFSNGHDGSEINSLSRRSSVEEDICFPVYEEPGKTTKIDFEELEEFVAEQKARGPSQFGSQKMSTMQPKVFNDLRPKASFTSPRNVTEAQTSDDSDNQKGGGDLAIDEKLPGFMTPRGDDEREDVGMHSEPANQWTFFSSDLDDTIHAPGLGDLLMPGESFRDLFELSADGGVWWLDMTMPTQDEIFIICKAFGVHPLTREDITTQETREKVELFHNYYFVCFRSFYQMDKTSEDFLEPVNVYAIVFREGLLTFSFCQNPHAANVRRRLGKLRDYLSLSADWICYAMIDDIIDSFGPVIRDVEYETDAIEDQVFTARSEDHRNILRSIGECRKRVILLLRLLGGKADVIKGFGKRCNHKVKMAPSKDVYLYLSDVQDHVVTMMSNLGHFEKMLSRSHSNYLAQISLDNLQQGNSVNMTLGKVTLIATILVPLNLICGLFGMNVPVPGKDSDSLGWFFGILGCIFLIVFTCLMIAKRMRAI